MNNIYRLCHKWITGIKINKIIFFSILAFLSSYTQLWIFQQFLSTILTWGDLNVLFIIFVYIKECKLLIWEIIGWDRKISGRLQVRMGKLREGDGAEGYDCQDGGYHQGEVEAEWQGLIASSCWLVWRLFFRISVSWVRIEGIVTAAFLDVDTHNELSFFLRPRPETCLRHQNKRLSSFLRDNY